MARLLRRDLDKQGLYRGVIHFSLQSTESKRYRTRGRGDCDAAILLVIHPDGSTDGILSHLYSTPGYRLGHADLLDDIAIPITPQDQTFALLLATKSGGKLKHLANFEEIKSALARKNNGKEPEIVLVDFSQAISPESEIVFTQQAVEGGFRQILEVTNSEYRKEFRFGTPELVEATSR